MIFQTGVSTFFLPIAAQIALAKRSGFEGIELLVTQRNCHIISGLCQKVWESGLNVSLHQSWSLSENPTHFHNKVFDALGILPKSGYALRDLLGNAPNQYPLTLYADRIREEFEFTRKRFQTCSAFKSDLTYKLPYREFVQEVRARDAKVTFDTQHVLEYKLNVRGVEAFGQFTPEMLLDVLITSWEELGGPHKIAEVHWNDFDPRLGHTRGRNVFPGTGILPLAEFAWYIRSMHWQGVIIPEVGPGTIIFNGRKLRETTAGYFK